MKRLLTCVLLVGHALGQGAAKAQKSFVTVASYYGRKFAGKEMADGRKFDPRRLTTAHRSLPLGSWIKVTLLRNRKSVCVQITDRGPWVQGRGLDLSEEAARRLGMIGLGIAKVRVDTDAPECKQ